MEKRGQGKLDKTMRHSKGGRKAVTSKQLETPDPVKKSAAIHARRWHPAIEPCLNRDESIVIRYKGSGILPYKPLEPHIELFTKINAALLASKSYWETRVKPRQYYYSTGVSVVGFQLLRYFSGFSGIVLAHSGEASETLWDMYRLHRDYNKRPIETLIDPSDEEGLSEAQKRKQNRKLAREKDSARRMMLPNRSQLMCTIAKDTLGKAGSYQFAHLSEIDFYEGEGVNTKIMWSDFYETLPSPEMGFSLVIMESTRDPVSGGWLEEMWHKAGQGVGRFVQGFDGWHKVKGRNHKITKKEKDEVEKSLDVYEKGIVKDHGVTLEQIHWMRQSIAESGNAELWKIQNPLVPEDAFGTSVAAAFKKDDLKWYTDYSVCPPTDKAEVLLSENMTDYVLLTEEECGTTEPRLYLWQNPVPGHEYHIGADPAAESALMMERKSQTAAIILDATLGEQVGTWVGQINPHEFGDVLYALGRYLNWAYITCEATGIGLTTISRLVKGLGYPSDRVYHEEMERTDGAGPSLRMGWSQTPENKQKLVSAAQRVIHGHHLRIHDERIIKQCSTFVQKKPGIFEKARPTDLDDLVICLGMVCHVAMKGRHWGPKDRQWVHKGRPSADPAIIDMYEPGERNKKRRERQIELMGSLYGRKNSNPLRAGRKSA